MYAGDEDFPPWRTPFAKSRAEAHNPGTHSQDLNLGYGRQATGDRGGEVVTATTRKMDQAMADFADIFDKLTGNKPLQWQ